MPVSKSDRIKILKAVAAKLAREDWATIDLTLQEFELRTSDRWGGTSEEYVLEYARAASDAVLLELAEHLGVSTGLAAAPPARPTYWEEGDFPLFLSHLADERKFAGDLQTELRRFGISAFVAHNDITPTTEWEKEIELALSTCGALIALMHKGFHASKWTDQEIGYAMGRGVPVFSVRLGETPYGFIGKFQAFNGSGKTESDIAREIFDALRTNKQTQYNMADVLVRLFEESGSFATANARMGYLKELEVWKSGYLKRLDKAYESNNQISGSFEGKPGIADLKKKWKHIK